MIPHEKHIIIMTYGITAKNFNTIKNSKNNDQHFT